MPSIKQVEAFFWSAQLGSFVAAADRLNTTQSNISKRIQDLEYMLGVELFDRAKRAIRTTAKGEELRYLSAELLRLHVRICQVGTSDVATRGPFRFGVTEAVAITWLARFSVLVKESFPGLVPIATVDTSAHLNELLMARKIDMAIGTDTNLDPVLVRIPLDEAERVWVAAPGLIEGDAVLTARDIGELPMLGHGEDIFHARIRRHLQDSGVTPNIVTSCSSMSALARMVMDGVGITYLHRAVFATDIEAGRLKVLRSEVEIPAVRYVAAYRNDVISPVAAQAAEKAREACDFRHAPGVR